MGLVNVFHSIDPLCSFITTLHKPMAIWLHLKNNQDNMTPKIINPTTSLMKINVLYTKNLSIFHQEQCTMSQN